MQFFSASFAKNPKQTLFHTTLGWVCVCVSQGKNLDNVGDGGKGGGKKQGFYRIGISAEWK